MTRVCTDYSFVFFLLDFFFFFQAEDGIRDVAVTGVQTCALPICRTVRRRPRAGAESRAVLRRGRSAADRPPPSPAPGQDDGCRHDRCDPPGFRAGRRFQAGARAAALDTWPALLRASPTRVRGAPPPAE